MPRPAFDYDDNEPRVDSYVVDRIVEHRRGPGRPSVRNDFNHRRLRDFGSTQDLYSRCAPEIPQCRKMLSVYRAGHGLGVPPESWSLTRRLQSPNSNASSASVFNPARPTQTVACTHKPPTGVIPSRLSVLRYLYP